MMAYYNPVKLGSIIPHVDYITRVLITAYMNPSHVGFKYNHNNHTSFHLLTQIPSILIFAWVFLPEYSES